MAKDKNKNQIQLTGTEGAATSKSKPVSELEAKARAEMAAAKGKLKTAKLLDKFIGIISTLDEWGCGQVNEACFSRRNKLAEEGAAKEEAAS